MVTLRNSTRLLSAVLLFAAIPCTVLLKTVEAQPPGGGNPNPPPPGSNNSSSSIAGLQKLMKDRAVDRANRPKNLVLASTPRQAFNSTPNAQMAQLGKNLFFDTNLSNPAGMSCASCHDPATGWAFPNSNTNQTLGVAPGVVPGRFGNRKVPAIGYSAYSPNGLTYNKTFSIYIGGLFWDGRAADLATQAQMPFVNPNEMDNLVHNVAAPALVQQAVAKSTYAQLVRDIYGNNVFALAPSDFMTLVGSALQAFQETPAFIPFTSKYDAYLLGKAKLSASEMNGLRLVTGSTTGRPGGPAFTKNAQCATCHGIPSDPTTGPDLWSNFVYTNNGVPKNKANPYYTMTDSQSNPVGYNPLGADYIDLGLGDYLYPTMNLPSGNLGTKGNGLGDFLAVNGTFKAPTLRNVDKRPNSTFVKAYMHNGVFKSLPQVVHFYNTRNLTSQAGEVIDFTKANPYAGLKGKPLWAPPEFISTVTLQNPTGAPGSSSALVGNLSLTKQDEDDIVAFLGTLSDGFFQR